MEEQEKQPEVSPWNGFGDVNNLSREEYVRFLREQLSSETDPERRKHIAHWIVARDWL
jgi:hypothetical protein